MSALPIEHVARLEPAAPGELWLVDHLWGRRAVGIIGGPPKCCKSFLALDLAVSVATGTPALGRFRVAEPGRALVYLAEDALPVVRGRIAGIAGRRGLGLDEVDVHVITASALRIDQADDQQALAAALAELRPRLLVLDPLVRLHRLDENGSGDMSGLLGYLRRLQREHDVAIALVHHMSKRIGANLGQSLRGSTDLHGWGDSNAYLLRRRDRLVLTLEHRAAAAPEPITLSLVSDPRWPDRAHLEAIGHDEDDAPPPLPRRIRSALTQAGQPLSRAALRRQLRVNNNRLGETLAELERHGLVVRRPEGWTAADDDAPAARQLSLA